MKDIKDLYGCNLSKLPVYSAYLNVGYFEEVEPKLITIKKHNTTMHLPRPFYKLIVKPF